MKTKVFSLSNLVLYAKGWYKQTDNIWEDLKQILELDDYTPYNNTDVYSIILSNFEKWDIYNTSLREVLIGIHPNQCWKVGYYTKAATLVNNHDKLPEYDMPTAFIHYVLSTLMFIDNEHWKPIVPKYKKYSKNPEITIRNLMDCFNNKKIKLENVGLEVAII